VGLGNPGPEYDGTRHNAGFRLADHLVTRWRLGTFKRGERARQAQGIVDGRSVVVLKPQTYMNRSGAALAPLRAREGFDPAADLLILVDDVALPVGRFRLRGAGSAGGHNGLKSIEGALQRQDYARLRIRSARCPQPLRARRLRARPVRAEEWRPSASCSSRCPRPSNAGSPTASSGGEPVQPVRTMREVIRMTRAPLFWTLSSC
jgi:PTH1 family peptidyl-tRNA hydrolase